MKPRREYKNPPIVEALVEIQFSPSQEWNPIIPFDFYGLIKSDYSGIPRDRMEMSTHIEREEGQSHTSVQTTEKLDRVQYPNEDGTKLVALGANLLSVHVLKPYPGWVDFSKRISAAIDAYLAAAKPSGVLRVGLRYINKIEIPCEGTMNLQEYFTSPPSLAYTDYAHMSNFFMRLESQFNDAPIRMAQSFGSAGASEGNYGFLLDFDLFRSWSDSPLPCDQVVELISEMRDLERDVFESYITESTREIFDA